MAASVANEPAELDELYRKADPWNYEATPDDKMRVEMLLAELPARRYRRTLDVGCGNGVLT